MQRHSARTASISYKIVLDNVTIPLDLAMCSIPYYSFSSGYLYSPGSQTEKNKNSYSLHNGKINMLVPK